MKRGWKPKHCAKHIKLGLLESKTEGDKTSYKIKDPNLGKFISIPDSTHVEDWYLAGSFGYMDARINGDIHNCCEHRHEESRGCFDEVQSCLVAIYRPIFLGALGMDDKELKKLGEGGHDHDELGRVLGKTLGLSLVELEELEKELKKLHKEDAKVKKASSVSWTLGALICEEDNCLPKRAPDECPWLTDSKCLVPPKKKETEKTKK